MMDDRAFAICHLVGRQAVLRKDFIGATNPWASSYINADNIKGLQTTARIDAAQPANPQGNPTVTQSYMRQGEQQMTAYNDGYNGWSGAQFERRLATSTQRNPATISTSQSDPTSGFGGSGNSGVMAQQVGGPAAKGTETLAPPAAPVSPQPPTQNTKDF